MKRSAMVDDIRKRFEYRFEDLNYYDFSELLGFIEELGMLPPKYSACIITRQPKKRGECDIYGWEPEDE